MTAPFDDESTMPKVALGMCSFCGTLQGETVFLVQGPIVSICDGCWVCSAQQLAPRFSTTPSEFYDKVIELQKLKRIDIAAKRVHTEEILEVG